MTVDHPRPLDGSGLDCTRTVTGSARATASAAAARARVRIHDRQGTITAGSVTGWRSVEVAHRVSVSRRNYTLAAAAVKRARPGALGPCLTDAVVLPAACGSTPPDTPARWRC